jgi:hypothetical protein
MTNEPIAVIDGRVEIIPQFFDGVWIFVMAEEVKND